MVCSNLRYNVWSLDERGFFHTFKPFLVLMRIISFTSCTLRFSEMIFYSNELIQTFHIYIIIIWIMLYKRNTSKDKSNIRKYNKWCITFYNIKRFNFSNKVKFICVINTVKYILKVGAYITTHIRNRIILLAYIKRVCCLQLLPLNCNILFIKAYIPRMRKCSSFYNNSVLKLEYFFLCRYIFLLYNHHM